ncbi:xylulokinase [Thermoleptolyngbya oregonensis NK1-22]|uniref:Xylulose kinase n=1 Tax=Thermoleptolyngbya oregonensis NK1-22 TaxID=2547457 RepID=A0AA96Y5K3_9CYAN|nr:xylulokinase [Thermoleptolyngbya oregonensis]WOB43039.1 xylulokinase [Thermoleptolyngbya oregonensis NK1-22]
MFLGIDLGTSSLKALLMSADGTVIAEASHPYPVNAPHPGWAESDPQDWWNAGAIAVRKAVQSYAAQVQAIGLSGQMHGVVVCDGAGNPLRSAILWADGRSHYELEHYRALGTEALRPLANPLTVGMAGPSLLWLRQGEPEVYRMARWALQPKDWLRLRLTGQAATEPSDASGTLMADVAAGTWAIALLEALHLRTDWLPPIVASRAIAGTLTRSAAEHLGLPADLPVVAGAADTAAALLGSGLTTARACQLTVGTGAQITLVGDRPTLDPHGCTHLFHAALPNQWYTLAAMQNAGLALEWVRQLLGLSWADLYDQAFTVEPGCDGLVCLPYLTGERTPHLDPTPTGAWIGLGLHHTRAHLARAALEGVAFAIAQGFAALQATGANPDTLYLAGGGSLHPQWRQLLADVLQRPLHSLETQSASSRGAALLARLGIGQDRQIGEPWKKKQAISGGSATQIVPAPQITVPNPPSPALETAHQRFAQLYPAVRSQL